MTRNIILCSDGTGNTANKGRGTNVFKLFEALDLHGHITEPNHPEQIAFYDDGVGAMGSVAYKAFSGATGWGLSSNVQQLYRDLCRTYRPGDRIYMFGFSRGAYTVRTLAGLVTKHGIVRPDTWKHEGELKEHSQRIWKSHRYGFKGSWLSNLWRKLLDRKEPSVSGIKTELCWPNYSENAEHKVPNTPIEMVGVWDTVSAYGFPVEWVATLWNKVIYNFKFPDQKLNEHVKRGYHALSIDDERSVFEPTLWEASEGRIEQTWFSGVHSNIGGGYVKQGMSLVTLDWMMERAEKAQLKFDGSLRANYTARRNVNDMLYNPRTGIGVGYHYAPRDIARLSCKVGEHVPNIHISVFDRVKPGTAGYAPMPLGVPRKFKIVGKELPSNDSTNASSDIGPNEGKTLSENTAQDFIDLATKIAEAARAQPRLFSDVKSLVKQRRDQNFCLLQILLWTGLVALLAAFINNVSLNSILICVVLFSVLPALIFLRGYRASVEIRNQLSEFWRHVFRDHKPQEPS